MLTITEGEVQFLLELLKEMKATSEVPFEVDEGIEMLEAIQDYEPPEEVL